MKCWRENNVVTRLSSRLRIEKNADSVKFQTNVFFITWSEATFSMLQLDSEKYYGFLIYFVNFNHPQIKIM
ncbi:hypothetical protein DU508_08185 [Pedobacter chinensis]|uniref:Uncharacterized protein n=1 Tax=Pedobacter chinensis TaxID=2282421 RepID=A0A369Q1N6_9SPHI|nr:hypothetical protein DU508_08185 [Pedobacter chinensis]